MFDRSRREKMTSERYLAKQAWPDINDTVAEKPVVLIPAGTFEDHGLHLPIDTDIVIARAMCEEALASSTVPCVIGPDISLGYSPHHIDGPGTITIRWDVFVNYVRDVLQSLIYHGFYKILIVNGHGSNASPLDLAARLANVANPDARCAVISWWELNDVGTTVAEFRDSTWTGHACELETSLYMALDLERVHTDRFRADDASPKTRHVWADLVGQAPEGYARNPIHLTEYWSSVSETGTWGDPAVSSAEKGQLILSAAGKELAEIAAELRSRVAVPREAHQLPEVAIRNERHFGAAPSFLS
jgi:creatinine amidohydrolase